MNFNDNSLANCGSSYEEIESQLDKINLNDELEEFRRTWHNEIKSNKSQTAPSDRFAVINNNDYVDIDETHKEAMQYFKEGAFLEQKGKLYDAVMCYRKATQLVPDIEFKMYHLEQKLFNQKNDQENKQNSTLENNNYQNEDDNNDDDNDDEECDLITKFLKSNTNNFGNLFLCSPAEDNGFIEHFSCLPYEVVIYILKWVFRFFFIIFYI